MAVHPSALHWVTMGVAYTLSGLGFWMLYDAFEDRDIPLRLYLLTGATALPAVPSLLASTLPGLLLGINYEPLGVAVFAVGVALFTQDSFVEFSAPGSSQLVNALSEGVLLIDEAGTVVNHNENAERMYPPLARGATSLAALDPRLAELSPGDQTVVTTTVRGTTRHYRAERKSLAAGPRFITTTITLTDVTRLVDLREITRLHSAVNAAIVEERAAQDLLERVCEELASVGSYRFVWYANAERPLPAHVAGDPDGYVEAVTPRPAATDERPDPVVAALQDGPATVEFPSVTGGDGAPAWERAADERAVTACAVLSVPVSDRRALGVYTTDPEGFSDPERAMLAEIRGTLDHALSAIETQAQSRRYREAVDRAGHALLITDADGTIRYVNPAFEEVTGYSESDVLGATPESLAGESSSFGAGVGDALAEGDVWEGEVKHRTKSGERYWAQRTVAPVTDDDGRVTAAVVIEIDVTDRRIREQRLNVLNRVLRHNLRNEMNVISGNADLVLDRSERGAAAGDVAEHAAEIKRAAAEVIRLSEKVRRVGRHIDTDDPAATVRLGSVFDRLHADLAAEYPDARVELSPPADPDVPVSAAVEPALVELADNSLEHNDGDPRVRVEATVESSRDRLEAKEEVVLTVADNGPGLPSFEREVLERGVESPLEHGSGLGLWLANWLVLESRGTIQIDVDESGTTVTLRLPTLRADASSPPSASAESQ